MMPGLTITKKVHFQNARRGRKVIEEGAVEETPDLGRVPRISRLMALAIHMDNLVRRGEVTDYADLARLAHVTRARISQIMALLHLACNHVGYGFNSPMWMPGEPRHEVIRIF